MFLEISTNSSENVAYSSATDITATAANRRIGVAKNRFIITINLFLNLLSGVG
jgi:hypothetical protein